MIRAALGAILMAGAALGQSFEVASIRPHIFTGGGGARLGVASSGNLVIAKGGPKLKAAGPDARGGAALGNGRLRMGNVPMARFALGLTSIAGRPVVDKTGLAENYDIMLEWAPDNSPDPGPSLFTALQEQLGLKLEAAKASTEMLVIDHAKKPSEN